ncbi:MAG: class I SAM-dependent methyltransferase [Actinomycetota bacterium]|nr:class I SAM-dependent methyltransferase [Actinomycetota bacterium]
MAYREHNRRAWSYLAGGKDASTRPWNPNEVPDPKALLDPHSWIPWAEVHSVLCLAAGGGQQGPLFASLGMRVTVFDLSVQQLEADRRAAEQAGLAIDTVEGDMADLNAFSDCQFDLVYQPISSQYVPDIRQVYREALRVTRPGGCYWVEHWNPAQIQLSERRAWDGEAYRIIHPHGTGVPLAWEHATDGDEPAVSWNYVHSLETLIGGLCDAGFVIMHFAERHDADLEAPPGSTAHISAYIPTFLSTFAQRPF